MCTAPILIKNPNRGLKPKHGWQYYLTDVTSQYIQVPCGHCKQCIANRQMQITQRVQMEAKVNHLYFCTLTYNEEMIPKITTSTGYTIKYADIKDIQNLFKRLRKRDYLNRKIKYLAVSELGKQGGRAHFHIIWMIEKKPKDTYLDILNIERILYEKVLENWSRNIGTRKNPIYKPCCIYKYKHINGKRYCTYDLHYINPNFTEDGEASVAFYVSKYMLKEDTREIRLQQALKLNLDEEEYNKIWKKIKSRYCKSHDFGAAKTEEVRNYIKQCIEQSKDDEYLKFFNPATGAAFPLAKKYLHDPKIVTNEIRIYRYKHNKQRETTELTIPEYKRPDTNKHFQEQQKKQDINNKYEKESLTEILINQLNN